ncbi:hypothetical protein AYO50_01790 [Acidobacteria bacterium SCGC AG-212-P17]|nr:hypothetical protein AYO50_01790 [Acidobacteria bacterium SCGC AG-212-P17]
MVEFAVIRAELYAVLHRGLLAANRKKRSSFRPSAPWDESNYFPGDAHSNRRVASTAQLIFNICAKAPSSWLISDGLAFPWSVPGALRQR